MSLRGLSAAYHASRRSEEMADPTLAAAVEAVCQTGAFDYAHALQITETVKSVHDPRTLQEIVRRLRKKLKPGNYHEVQLNSLAMLAVLMQECGPDLHLAVSNRKLMLQMTKMVKVGAKKGATRFERFAADRVLELIETWGNRFHLQQALVPDICNAYEDLKKKKYAFPGKSTFGEIFERSSPSDRDPRLKPSAPRPTLDLATNVQEQADTIRNTVQMLAEMLFNAKSKVEVKNNEIINELVEHCSGIQNQIARELSAENENNFETLLGLNDQLVEVLFLHKRSVEVGPPSEGQKPTIFQPPKVQEEEQISQQASTPWDAWDNGETPSNANSEIPVARPISPQIPEQTPTVPPPAPAPIAQQSSIAWGENPERQRPPNLWATRPSAASSAASSASESTETNSQDPFQDPFASASALFVRSPSQRSDGASATPHFSIQRFASSGEGIFNNHTHTTTTNEIQHTRSVPGAHEDDNPFDSIRFDAPPVPQNREAALEMLASTKQGPRPRRRNSRRPQAPGAPVSPETKNERQQQQKEDNPFDSISL